MNIMNTSFDSLAQTLRARREHKDILLVSHAVLGYPSFDGDRESIGTMVDCGVDIIELQIPFSDPLADGPYFTHANEIAVRNGTKVRQCFDFAREMHQQYPDQVFVFMTYYNIIYRYGPEQFARDAAQAGMCGMIVPDLPVFSDEGQRLRDECNKNGITLISMVTPETDADRMREIAKVARGFVYVQARIGVTGHQTSFDAATDEYLSICREIFSIPIAVGFGITCRDDVQHLHERADIAICCTQAVKVYVEHGAIALGKFLRGLR